jgi:hypothetical protein
MVPKSIYFALAIHNHQPVGNFDHIFDEAYKLAYLPMLEALERHPRVQLALHYSGPLRDWLVNNHPDFIARVRALVQRGQVEIMGGGYYEPVLVALPDADKLGQIHKMSQTAWEDFGYRVRGGWLAERVWEPHLPKAMAEAGIEYTIVDDTHFKYVGMEDRDLLGYYVTEEQGARLKIFGTSKHLRYIIPWGTVEEVINYLRSEADESGSRVAVMGDDGEKFGLWPRTYAHCWGERGSKGWIEEFFSTLEANADWLHLLPPGEYAERFPPLGRIYLPAASYDEMTEWALPAPVSDTLIRLKHRLEMEGETSILRFLRGGMWRSFMVKYPEINTMHKKMLWVSAKVHGMPESPEKQMALDELWQGQCNCPYWHGVFGGIYLFHIRSATYGHLLAAEAIADSSSRGNTQWLRWHEIDINCDGQPEVLLESEVHNAYFAPHEGGRLFEWDWRHRRINLANTLSRKEEGYHRILVTAAKEGTLAIEGETDAGQVESIHTTRVRARERGLETLLFRDWYQRALLLDHFLPYEATLAEFYRAQYAELGDFVDRPYAYQIRQEAEAIVLRLWREGGVWQGEELLPVRVEKHVRFPRSEIALHCHYVVTNLGEQELSCRFGVESNWALLGGDGPGAYWFVPGRESQRLNALGEAEEVSRLSLVLDWLRIRVDAVINKPARVWHFPIETISNSEAGFERVYQGSSVTTLWDLRLESGRGCEMCITYSLCEMDVPREH